MASNDYRKRFQESTRGRVVELLRYRSRTVEDLAQELGLTDNAVRTHLATLERDGIVRQEGVRRNVGAGKPAWIYGIAPEAEATFSHAYVPVLLALLEEIASSQTPEQFDATMRAVGRRLAGPLSLAPEKQARVQAAVTLLQDLGALAEVTEDNGRLEFQGHGCVIGAAVTHHPAICHAVETLLETILGEPVQEYCDRGSRPNCRFVVGVNGSAKTAS